jgi:hypothetical protein
MSDSRRSFPAEPGPADPDAVRADIDRTRAGLADTVDQLSKKLDVRAQTSHKANAAKDRASQTAARVKASAPPAVRQALDRTGEKVAPIAHRVSDQTAPHRAKLVTGVFAALGALALVRRRRTRAQS